MFSCSVLVYHPNTYLINQPVFVKFKVASDTLGHIKFYSHYCKMGTGTLFQG
jgi:hypothetical protein